MSKENEETSHQESSAASAFYGRVNRIRVEAENLLQFPKEIREALNHRNADFRQREARAIVASSKNIVDSNIRQITSYINEAKNILDNNPDLDADHGDHIVEIENVSELLRHDWPRIILELESNGDESQVMQPAAIDLSELSAQIDRVDRTLKKLQSLCGMVTAPSRVKKHLKQLRPGRKVNFHDYFSDEIPDPAVRTIVLRYLDVHPELVGGVVNVETGDIYKASPENRRSLNVGLIFLVPVAIGAAVIPLFYLEPPGDIQQWPFQRVYLSHYIYDCFFVFLGGAAHLVVDFIKQDRANRGTPVLALGDWLIWLDVQRAAFVKGAIFLVFGAIALFYLYQTVEWKMAFLVGYSIDSFLDIFLLRFTTFASQGLADIKEKLKPPSDGPTP